MIYGAGFLGHGRLAKVGTPSELLRGKAKLESKRGKGMAAKGVAYKCRVGDHSNCTSLTCACLCGHAGKNAK